MCDDSFEEVEVSSREELRAWLRENHRQRESIWLVTGKKAAGPRYLPYDAIVEEALCFDWIDSRPRGLDELRSMRMLSPRKPGSAWSRANKQRVRKLTESGAMTRAGLAKIEAARRDGSWDALNDVEEGRIPADLARELRRHEGARANFDAFPPSSRRIILEWIKMAKRAETRERRVREAAEKAARNERANHYRSG